MLNLRNKNIRFEGVHRVSRGFCVGFLLGISLQVQAVQDCSLNGAPVNPANGNTTEGKTGLMRCVERDSGELTREEELRAGKSVGVQRRFKHGKLQWEYSVNEKGNKQGRAREYADNGQVLRDETYDNGKLMGLTRTYYDTGVLRRVTHYATTGETAYAEFSAKGQLSELRCDSEPRLAPEVEDARLCGFRAPARVEFFSDKGTVRARVTLDKGQRVLQEFLYDNGAVQQIKRQQDGRRTEQSFSPEGVKLREDQFVQTERGSMKELEQRFADSGKLIQEKAWKDGELLSERSYYLNGQPKMQMDYRVEGGVRERTARDFHDNGKLSSEGRYLSSPSTREISVGVHQGFDEKGLLRYETTYDAKGRLTRERGWDAEGKLQRDDQVFEDGSRKAYTR